MELLRDIGDFFLGIVIVIGMILYAIWCAITGQRHDI